jgi:membrane associated rhomboid family serine protease
MLVLGLGVNLAFELLPTGISGAAHIGGAAAGLALLPLTRRRTTRRHRTGRITRTP